MSKVYINCNNLKQVMIKEDIKYIDNKNIEEMIVEIDQDDYNLLNKFYNEHEIKVILKRIFEESKSKRS